ncbi:MAG TPA: class I SAM-dependent methyltransferase, partial [Quisquiliibacterium sp.]|nr:class I SAM-dependent methyltransferase [Quisquiliibacterium sp.]
MSVCNVDSLSRSTSLPSGWVARWAPAVPAGARVLDYAGGSGRNLPPLLARGARVTVADRDAGALAGIGPAVERICADLESGPWPFDGRRFDAVVCCNYLFRPRLDLLTALVAPVGLLVYETFAEGNERFGRPSRPSFL